MPEFNRLEFNISYDHSLLGPQVVVEASWFDAAGNECSDYSTAAADDPNDGLRLAIAWLEENVGMEAPYHGALGAAAEALDILGAIARGEATL